ncbi:hypothetical protein WMY93_029579 [Mugilogobius chulae]|uniref:Uncharacterized protein n=1 Tax=Mugilogobius chulae TaxID=88201 RepID=A0AAW0MM25_9GOBI
MVLDRKKVPCPLRVGGESLPQVAEFKYLGVLFTSEGRMEREIDRRIDAASAVMQSLYRTVVVKKELSRKAKLSIYRSIYVPTLTYGHELWVMTERTRSRIQAVEMSFLRRVAGRSLRDKVRSSVTREELGVEPLLLHVERGQLRWLGHLYRMPPGRLPGEVFRACPTGRRPRGRPRTRWRDYVSRLSWERLGILPEELEEIYLSRHQSLLQLVSRRRQRHGAQLLLDVPAVRQRRGGAWLLLWATVDRCGRRGILLLFMTMTGLASLILLGLMEYLSEAAITVFSVLGLFSSQATASLCIFFTAEIMPTIIRGSGVGAVLALGCVGRLSSPLMDLRNHYGYFLHHVVFSSLALWPSCPSCCCPRARGSPSPRRWRTGSSTGAPRWADGGGTMCLCWPRPTQRPKHAQRKQAIQD